MRAAVLVAAVLAAAGAPGPSRAADGTADAVRDFVRAYASKDPRVRKKAVGMLEAIPGPEATAALLPALADEDSPVRQRAREVLRGRAADADLAVYAGAGLRSAAAPVRCFSASALGDAGARSAGQAGALAALLRDRDASVRETAAAALGATGHRGQAPAVAAAIRSERVPEVRGALLAALGRLDAREAAGVAASEAARSEEGPPCVAALRVLASEGPDGAASAATALLRHPAWEVRIEAAAALARSSRDAPAGMDALVAALAKEKRLRARAAVAAALETLAGVPLGEDADRWSAWWRRERAGWTPSRAPAPEAPRRGDDSEGTSRARFYDIPVDSDHVAFVLDTSRSMTDAARLGRDATKMQLALAEFAKTLAGLREPVVFNVFAFDTVVTPWRPRGVAAGPSARGEALRFMQKQVLDGRTNIFDALAAAMEDRETDTVFLLTDGAPSAGEETTRTGFLRGLAHLRRWRPVRVHAVEVGAGNTGTRWKGFLAEIAASTGGAHLQR